VATLLEKLEFQRLVEETLSVKRVTRVMSLYPFVLAMVLALYGGFWRLHPLRFLQRDPMRVGILKVLGLPPQCTFWRFRASLHLQMAPPWWEVQGRMRPRVWEAAPRAAEVGDLGHRHHRAHALWPGDGSPQGLQSAAQGEEELPALADVLC